LHVYTGGGDDSLQVIDVLSADAEVKLMTGIGDDTVEITGLASASVSVFTSAGDDLVMLGQADEDETSLGVDIAGEISLNSGVGDDEVSIETLATASLDVATKQGDDIVTIDADLEAALGAALNLDTGPGEDIVQGVVEDLLDSLPGQGNANGLVNRLSRLDDVFSDLARRIDSSLVPLDDPLALVNGLSNGGQTLNLGRLNGLSRSLLGSLG
jgi:hypothetical protein